ncbi:hypothetical protein [Aquiflexum lacus]|uniref:hypothetical protein n=1 Tax=Aquiflexum lacus TaxID=2483805 RepID=UPI001894E95C|nr:hypothetical protein [Aquiflexum lacus]
MEKSIESIWKQGFLDSDALVAPKVNDLYNRKSIHLIEKFKKMFQMNIWGIIIGAVILFVGSYLIGALIAGSILFIMLIYIAYTAYYELKTLEGIDKGQSSYFFLKSFKDWIDHSIDRYGKMYRVVYPLLLLTFYFGIWMSDVFAGMRELVAERTTDLIFGFHTYTSLVIIVAAILMSVFSKRIHKEDVSALYGGILKKLEDALAEMEELRDQHSI